MNLTYRLNLQVSNFDLSSFNMVPRVARSGSWFDIFFVQDMELLQLRDEGLIPLK